MKNIGLYAIAFCCAASSCTKAKTDYEAEINTVVEEHYAFMEAAVINSAGYKISLETLNGTFYKGYNPVHLKISDTRGNRVNASSVTFLPIMTDANNRSNSCPHVYDLWYNSDSNYFSGYAVFTAISSDTQRWKLYIGVTIHDKTYNESQSISVKEQTNKNLNMASFTGNDDEQYYIALIAPQKPKVAENELIAGIYKFNKPTHDPGMHPDPAQFEYTEVQGYTLLLDPRMPEPSMGNHSSLNNQDLVQEDDGFYHGVVNYTMTGNWTLNFIMQNQNGKIIKGTEVPKDFTPGVEGVKSELYIDILF